MTILTRSLNKPRLRERDANCIISWFEGADSFSNIATTGDYANQGSLGDLSDLRLNTENSKVRVPIRGISGVTPYLNTAGFYLYDHGLSTTETTIGEGSSITIEAWCKLEFAGGSFILHKLYGTGATPWNTPFMSMGIGLDANKNHLSYFATSGSSFTAGTGSSTQGLLLLNEWAHLALTWTSGSTVNQYTNGVLTYQSGSQSMQWGSHGRWAVGGRGGRGGSGTGLNGEGFIGAIQGARVHSVERSASWIRDTYRMGVGS